MKVNRGFTITELMMVIAISAILMSLAVPSFENLIRRSAVKKVEEDLFAELIIARSEAISRSRAMSLCPLANPDANTPACSADVNDWNKGWLLFTDTNRDGAISAASGNIPEDQIVQFYANRNASKMRLSNTKLSITYERRGTLKSGDNSTFLFCDNGIGFKHAIILSPGTGRAYYSDKKSDGSALECN